MVLYDFVKDHVTEISIDDIIDHSHPDCGFESTVQGWATNTQIKLIISPPPADPPFEEQPCFKKARVFIYDLEKKALLQFH